MKLFGSSAHGKTITNKNIVGTSYGNENNISKQITDPHFKDWKNYTIRVWSNINLKRKYNVLTITDRCCS